MDHRIRTASLPLLLSAVVLAGAPVTAFADSPGPGGGDAVPTPHSQPTGDEAADAVVFPTARGLPAGEGSSGAVVYGTVRDPAGQPLADARVLVVELDRAVLTDAHGAFRLEDIPAGRYTLEVRRPGYRARLVHVTLPASGPIEVTLREDPVPIDPLTVTVTRGALSPLRSPLAASTVGRDALDREQIISLAHTLERLPGVRTLSTGSEIGKPVIRGLSGSRVLVLSQGLPLADYAWSDEDGPSIDAAMADRIEVVRGPATVLYGADAVGGVVNVIPRPLPEATGGQRWMDGSVEVGAKSNNRETDLILRGEGAGGPWGWRAMVTGRRAEALHTPTAELENTGFMALTGDAAVARRGDWGSLTARYARYGGEFRLLEEDASSPTGGAQPEEEGGPERKLSDDRIQLLGNFPLGSVRLETRLQGQRHHLIEVEDDPQASPGSGAEVEVFNLLLSTAYGEALLHHSLAPGLSGTLGVSGELQHSGSGGVIPLIPDAGIAAGGVFLLESYRTGPLTLLAGARTDLEALNAEGHPQRAFSALSGSAGAAVQVADGVAVTANVGTAWRAPTLFELYAEGPRLGEGRYEIGDPTLDEENALDLDVGLKWERGPFRGSVAAYRNDFDRFLFIQPTDELRDGYRVFDYRQADARLEGGEAALELRATPWLSLTATGELVRGTNQELDEPLPLIPPKRARFGAEVHGTTGWAERAYAGIRTEVVAAPDRLNPFDIAVDGYTLVDLSAGVSGHWRGRSTRVDLSVRNALEERYRDFLSRYKAFALDPGRDVVVRVRMGI